MKYLLLLPLFFFISVTASAQIEYKNLAPIPQLTVTETSDISTIESFLKGALPLFIGIAGALAVIMIIIGGIQYLSTDAWGGKKDAKKTIQNALTGLVLVIASFSILYTVNPKLVNFNLSLEGVGTTTNFGLGGGIPKKTAVETGCIDNCVVIDPSVIPIKPYGYACSNDPCYVNSTLEAKLQQLDIEMKKAGVAWQVTEAYPPTVPHESACHKSGSKAGKCVDASLFQPNNANILKFLAAIEKVFGPNASYLYERCDNNKKNPLASDPAFKDFKDHLTCEAYTNAQHAHINI